MPFAAGCLIIHDWHVLLNLRGEGESCPLTWSQFGGSARRGEGAAACMLREVLEEASIALDPSRCAFLHSLRRPDWAYHTFVAFPRECPRATLGSESRSSAWFPLGTTPATLWSGLPRPLHPGLAELAESPGAALALLSLRAAGPRQAPRAALQAGPALAL